MKKILTVFLAITLMSIAFSKTTLVHWMHHSPKRAEIIYEMSEEFMKENPDVEIVIQSIPYSEYKTKLLAAIAAGSGPDVAQIPAEAIEEFYNYQIIQPFPEDIVSSKEMLEKNIEPAVKNLIIDDEVYGLPTDIQTIVLFYNPYLFEKAGLDPDKAPEDWNELIDFAKKTTVWENDKMIESGWGIAGYHPVLESFMRSAGATFWADGDKKQIKLEQAQIDTYEFFRKAIEEDKVYTPKFGSRWTGFRQIKEAMVFGHGAMVGSFKVGGHPDLIFKTAPIPKNPTTGKRITSLTSWSLVIMDDCQESEAAAKWLKFITSEDSQKLWLEQTGELPSLKSVINDPKYKNDELFGPILDSLSYAEPTFSKGWANPAGMMREVGYNEILNKGVPVKEAAEKVVEQINIYLDETFSQF
ncbi:MULTISPECIES: extracellular solute-binding protein [Oceanotoga]|jgi:multiple sugar transport system substrate-binding protein|uniref:Carbohydrate ABC transporter substrate-binding protein (CUT1 family) n=1 Tax=Oceanotoga teriensis TaxID=515440 RepID=A0AA45HJB4_9BACT|nr:MULTISPECIES: extracellular solute-binding protein [Oceanotoga]MDN5342490.1 multiple sugar transport system substrate-binding protein [Oceanotoga sp.]MDO7977510.1 extracellular solute-binding protein [Oceanotoga teriensis]PWJ95622.1 carbohydrate ABC transporter substrate-binding protein (CUT1 family) [Oceanotoga teriensis]